MKRAECVQFRAKIDRYYIFICLFRSWRFRVMNAGISIFLRLDSTFRYILFDECLYTVDIPFRRKYFRISSRISVTFGHLRLAFPLHVFPRTDFNRHRSGSAIAARAIGTRVRVRANESLNLRPYACRRFGQVDGLRDALCPSLHIASRYFLRDESQIFPLTSSILKGAFANRVQVKYGKKVFNKLILRLTYLNVANNK